MCHHQALTIINILPFLFIYKPTFLFLCHKISPFQINKLMNAMEFSVGIKYIVDKSVWMLKIPTID